MAPAKKLGDKAVESSRVRGKKTPVEKTQGTFSFFDIGGGGRVCVGWGRQVFLFNGPASEKLADWVGEELKAKGKREEKEMR